MIANPAIPNPAAVPHPFTLNDLRTHASMAQEPSGISPLILSGLGLAGALAIGLFVWLDPLHLFTPTEASPPAPAFVPSPVRAQPTEKQEIIAPQTPALAMKPVEVPIATAPAVQAPHVPAPMVQHRAASIKPESRGKPMDKENTAVLQASPMEKSPPPMSVTKPEENTDAPILPKLGDDTKNAPKPAATNDQNAGD